MAQYKCFSCEKAVTSKQLEKRFVCQHCGAKIFYKPRLHIVKIKAV